MINKEDQNNSNYEAAFFAVKVSIIAEIILKLPRENLDTFLYNYNVLLKLVLKYIDILIRFFLKCLSVLSIF